MIKFLLLFLCSFIFSSSAQDFVLKNYTENNFNVEFNLEEEINFLRKGEYTSINTSKGYTSVIGMPKLPMYSTMVMLNPEKEYQISYNVKSSRIINDIKVIPNQHIVNGLEKEEIDNVDRLFYNSENIYPYVPVSLSESMVMRDIVVSNVIVVPFRYNPLYALAVPTSTESRDQVISVGSIK